jgi:phosphate transport system permease protein
MSGAITRVSSSFPNFRDKKRLVEYFWDKTIVFFGSFSIIILILIFIFLLKDGLPLFKIFSLRHFVVGRIWRPISDPAEFGILPLIAGSFVVAIGAALISVPLGVGCAVYIAEIANPRAKETLKVLVELIAGIPSVVLGFLGVIVLSNWVKDIFDLPTGLTAFTGSIMLAFMAVPTIATISEDAIYSVPSEYRQASLALGATRWQTIYRVVIPASMSGLLAAALLGVGRVIGETMVVMMVCGNAPVMPHTIFQPVRTMTATIAAEMGETVRGSGHYHALFAVGIMLFIISFIINLVSDLTVRKKGARA